MTISFLTAFLFIVGRKTILLCSHSSNMLRKNLWAKFNNGGIWVICIGYKKVSEAFKKIYRITFIFKEKKIICRSLKKRKAINSCRCRFQNRRVVPKFSTVHFILKILKIANRSGMRSCAPIFSSASSRKSLNDPKKVQLTFYDCILYKKVFCCRII